MMDTEDETRTESDVLQGSVSVIHEGVQCQLTRPALVLCLKGTLQLFLSKIEMNNNNITIKTSI